MLAATVLIVAASFATSRPAVGTAEREMSGSSVPITKVFRRS
ncbi:MAG TPA: hypothetical protein VM183_09640 [Burkholderiales bacterium]|nr:hypothetical protein [Burkholderiales bacterium]